MSHPDPTRTYEDDDFPGSEYREAIKKSMSEPFKPLNRRQAAYARFGKPERRRTWLQRTWDDYSDVVGMFLIGIGVLLVSAMGWLCFGNGEQVLKHLLNVR